MNEHTGWLLGRVVRSL